MNTLSCFTLSRRGHMSVTIQVSKFFSASHIDSGTPRRSMRSFMPAVALGIFLFSMWTAPVMAGSFARSTGKMDIGTTTNIFLPTTATGNACLTADTDNISAPATNYVGNFGAGTPCRNDFFVKSARQPSIFYTYFDFKRYRGFEGITGLAKFPAPVFGSASLSVLDGPVGNDTISTSNGSFASSETAVGAVVLSRNAKLQSDAMVTRNGTKAPGGIATSQTFDPWFFFPESDTQLTLQIMLQDISLTATSDPGEASAAFFHAFGSFGRGEVPGVSVLANWEEDIFLGASNNGILNLSQRTIFGNSSNPFTLLANEAYWLTAATQSGAVAVSEPPAAALLGFGIVILGAFRRQRSTRNRRIVAANIARTITRSKKSMGSECASTNWQVVVGESPIRERSGETSRPRVMRLKS